MVLQNEADAVNDSQPSGNRSLNERHCCELLTILITVLESVDIAKRTQNNEGWNMQLVKRICMEDITVEHYS